MMRVKRISGVTLVISRYEFYFSLVPAVFYTLWVVWLEIYFSTRHQTHILLFHWEAVKMIRSMLVWRLFPYTLVIRSMFQVRFFFSSASIKYISIFCIRNVSLCFVSSPSHSCSWCQNWDNKPPWCSSWFWFSRHFLFQAVEDQTCQNQKYINWYANNHN